MRRDRRMLPRQHQRGGAARTARPRQGRVTSMQRKSKPGQPGIEVRHGRDCRSRDAGRCNCSPSYRASVWSNRDRKRIRKVFPALAAAKSWRRDALSALERGALRAPSPLTLEQAATAWLVGAREGAIRTRSGDPYKPSVIRSYEASLRLRVLPALGSRRVSDCAVTTSKTWPTGSGGRASTRPRSNAPCSRCGRSTGGPSPERSWRSIPPRGWSCPPCAASATGSRRPMRPAC